MAFSAVVVRPFEQPWAALVVWFPLFLIPLLCELTRFDRTLAWQVLRTFESGYLALVMVTGTLATLLWSTAIPSKLFVCSCVVALGNLVTVPIIVLFDSAVCYPLWLKVRRALTRAGRICQFTVCVAALLLQRSRRVYGCDLHRQPC